MNRNRLRVGERSESLKEYCQRLRRLETMCYYIGRLQLMASLALGTALLKANYCLSDENLNAEVRRELYSSCEQGPNALR